MALMAFVTAASITPIPPVRSKDQGDSVLQEALPSTPRPWSGWNVSQQIHASAPHGHGAVAFVV